MDTVIILVYVLVMGMVYIGFSFGAIYRVSLKMNLTKKAVDEDIESIDVNELIDKLSYSRMINIPFVDIMVLVPINLFYIVGFIATVLYVLLSIWLFSLIF